MIKTYGIDSVTNNDVVEEREFYSKELEKILINIINNEDLIECEVSNSWDNILDDYFIFFKFKTTQAVINKYFFQGMDETWFGDTITIWIEIPYGVDDEKITSDFLFQEIKRCIKEDFIQNCVW